VVWVESWGAEGVCAQSVMPGAVAVLEMRGRHTDNHATNNNHVHYAPLAPNERAANRRYQQ